MANGGFGQGFGQAWSQSLKMNREQEEKERKKDRRNMMLLQLVGAPVAAGITKGITGAVQETFKEPVNRFFSEENAGTHQLKRDLSTLKTTRNQAAQVLKSISESDSGDGRTYYYKLNRDPKVTNLDREMSGLNANWKDDAALHEIYNQRLAAIEQQAWTDGEKDYNDLLILNSKLLDIKSEKEIGSIIKKNNPLAKNFGSAAIKGIKRFFKYRKEDPLLQEGGVARTRFERDIDDSIGAMRDQSGLNAETLEELKKSLKAAITIETGVVKTKSQQEILDSFANNTEIQSRLQMHYDNKKYTALGREGGLPPAQQWAFDKLSNTKDAPSSLPKRRVLAEIESSLTGRIGELNQEQVIKNLQGYASIKSTKEKFIIDQLENKFPSLVSTYVKDGKLNYGKLTADYQGRNDLKELEDNWNTAMNTVYQVSKESLFSVHVLGEGNPETLKILKGPVAAEKFMTGQMLSIVNGKDSQFGLETEAVTNTSDFLSTLSSFLTGETSQQELEKRFTGYVSKNIEQAAEVTQSNQEINRATKVQTETESRLNNEFEKNRTQLYKFNQNNSVDLDKFQKMQTMFEDMIDSGASNREIYDTFKRAEKMYTIKETVEIGGVEVAKGFQGIDVSQFNNPVLSKVIKDYKRDMYLSFLYSGDKNPFTSSELAEGKEPTVSTLPAKFTVEIRSSLQSKLFDTVPFIADDNWQAKVDQLQKGKGFIRSPVKDAYLTEDEQMRMQEQFNELQSRLPFDVDTLENELDPTKIQALRVQLKENNTPSNRKALNNALRKQGVIDWFVENPEYLTMLEQAEYDPFRFADLYDPQRPASVSPQVYTEEELQKQLEEDPFTLMANQTPKADISIVGEGATREEFRKGMTNQNPKRIETVKVQTEDNATVEYFDKDVAEDVSEVVDVVADVVFTPEEKEKIISSTPQIIVGEGATRGEFKRGMTSQRPSLLSENKALVELNSTQKLTNALLGQGIKIDEIAIPFESPDPEFVLPSPLDVQGLLKFLEVDDRISNIDLSPGFDSKGNFNANLTKEERRSLKSLSRASKVALNRYQKLLKSRKTTVNEEPSTIVGEGATREEFKRGMTEGQSLLQDKDMGKIIAPPNNRTEIDSAVENIQSVFKDPEHIQIYMKRIAAVESAKGENANTYKVEDDGFGAFQITKTTFKDLQNRLRGEGGYGKTKVQKWINPIEEEFGIDVTEVKFKDMVDPKVASLMARLLLKSSATPIPKTLEGQAELWKKEWNSLSELALGTVKQFIRDAKYFGNK